MRLVTHNFKRSSLFPKFASSTSQVHAIQTIVQPPPSMFTAEAKLWAYPKLDIPSRLHILRDLCTDAMSLLRLQQRLLANRTTNNEGNDDPRKDRGKYRPPYELAWAVGLAFEEGGVPYAIGGALAYGLWGTPRATIDVDVDIFVHTDEEVTHVLSVLQTVGELRGEKGEKLDLNDAKRLADEGRRFACFRVFIDGTAVEFFTSVMAYTDVARERRVRITDDNGRQIWFLSAESIVYFKLVMNRLKDHLDIYNVLLHQRNFDRIHVVNHIVKNFKNDSVGREDRLKAFLKITQDVDAQQKNK